MLHKFLIALVATAVCCTFAADAQQERCGVNEARYPCGRRCEERCNADLPKNCRGIKCEPPFGCRCKNGFARNPITDRCVPIKSCPITRCAKHEVLGTCGRICEGTCESPSQPEVCQRIDCKGVECRCDLAGGYVRSEKTNQCVAIDKC